MTNLTVTNAYSKGNARTKLTINGNVEIANYKSNETKPRDFVYAKVSEGNVNIHSHNSNRSTLDFSDKKYNVLLNIAKSSKDDSGAGELSFYDLRDMDKSKLGLDDSFVITKDLKAGIVNIYKKVGNKLTTWLHIDFETENEKTQKATSHAIPKSKKDGVKIETPARLKAGKDSGYKDILVYKHEDGVTSYIISGYNSDDARIEVERYYIKDHKLIEIRSSVVDDEKDIANTDNSNMIKVTTFDYENNRIIQKCAFGDDTNCDLKKYNIERNKNLVRALEKDEYNFYDVIAAMVHY